MKTWRVGTTDHLYYVSNLQRAYKMNNVIALVNDSNFDEKLSYRCKRFSISSLLSRFTFQIFKYNGESISRCRCQKIKKIGKVWIKCNLVLFCPMYGNMNNNKIYLQKQVYKVWFGFGFAVVVMDNPYAMLSASVKDVWHVVSHTKVWFDKNFSISRYDKNL